MKILAHLILTGFAAVSFSPARPALASIPACPEGFAHAGEVRRIEFAAGEKWLVSADRSTIKAWSLAEGARVGSATVPDKIGTFRASPTEPVVAILTGKYSVELRSLPDLKLVRSWPIGDYAESIAFSPDGKVVATGALTAMRLWSTASGELLRQIHTNASNSLAFSADGTWLASAGGVVIGIWQLSDYRKVREIVTPYRDGTVFTIIFTPDGKYLAAGSNNDEISLWHVPGGNPAVIRKGRNHALWTVTMGADGQTLLSADRGRVRVWNLPDGSPRSTWDAHTEQINSIASSSDGPTLITAGRDRTIRLWNASDQTLRRCLVDSEPEPKLMAQQDASKAAAQPRGEPKAPRKAVAGNRILDDTAFFSPDFAAKVRAASTGKGVIVPSPTPEIAKVEKKYGKADKVELKMLSVENGPTLLMAIHYYGDIGLGVANDRVMAVLKK